MRNKDMRDRENNRGNQDGPGYGGTFLGSCRDGCYRGRPVGIYPG